MTNYLLLWHGHLGAAHTFFFPSHVCEMRHRGGRYGEGGLQEKGPIFCLRIYPPMDVEHSPLCVYITFPLYGSSGPSSTRHLRRSVME